MPNNSLIRLLVFSLVSRSALSRVVLRPDRLAKLEGAEDGLVDVGQVVTDLLEVGDEFEEDESGAHLALAVGEALGVALVVRFLD